MPGIHFLKSIIYVCLCMPEYTCRSQRRVSDPRELFDLGAETKFWTSAQSSSTLKHEAILPALFVEFCKKIVSLDKIGLSFMNSRFIYC